MGTWRRSTTVAVGGRRSPPPAWCRRCRRPGPGRSSASRPRRYRSPIRRPNLSERATTPDPDATPTRGAADVGDAGDRGPRRPRSPSCSAPSRPTSQRVDPGQGRGDRPGAALPGVRGPPAHRGRARRGQDQPGQGPGPLDRLLVRPDPVHPRPAALRRRRASPSGTAATAGSSSGPARSSPRIVLGDEINRASPKTQSALLEAMAEGQVTVDNVTYPLGPPFMVIATQNPIEHEGTYPLPESQLDRFLMRVSVGYPSRDAEIDVLDAHGDHTTLGDIGPVVTAADVEGLIATARAVHVAPSLKGYLVDLADATRRHPQLALGMSPRATLSLHAGRPGPRRGRTAAPTSSPTTSRRSPTRCSATACWSPPRPSSRASPRPTVLDEILRAVPVPDRRAGLEPSMLTREGRLAGCWPRWLSLVAGRIFGSVELYVLGAVARRCSWLALAAHGGADPPPHRRGPRAAPAAGARRHARAGSTCGCANRGRGARPVLNLRDGVSGTRGARLLVGPARARASRPGPRTGCRPSAAASSPSARSRSSSPTRSAWPASRMTASGVVRAHRLPARRRARPAAADHRQRPAGRRRAPQLARARRRGLLRAARLRRRRRPAPGALALDRPPRRADGPPGRAAVAGSGHRAGRRPVVDQHRRVARAGDLGRRPASWPPAPAARTSSAWSPPTAPTRASPPATPTSRRSWSTWPASRPPTTPASGGCSTGSARSAGGGALVVVVALAPAADLDQLARLRRRFGSLTDRPVRPLVVGPVGPAVGDRRRGPAPAGPALTRRRLVRRRLEPARRAGSPGDALVERPDHRRGPGHRRPRPRPTTGTAGPGRPHRPHATVTRSTRPDRHRPRPATTPRADRRRAPPRAGGRDLPGARHPVAVVASFSRIFAGVGLRSAPLVVVAVVTHVGLVLARRRGLGLPLTAVLAVVGFVAADRAGCSSSTPPGSCVPTARHRRRRPRSRSTRSWSAFQEVVAPTPPAARLPAGRRASACSSPSSSPTGPRSACGRRSRRSCPSLTLFVFTALRRLEPRRQVLRHRAVRPLAMLVRARAPGGRARAVRRLAGRPGRARVGLAAARRARCSPSPRSLVGVARRPPPARGRRATALVDWRGDGDGPQLPRHHQPAGRHPEPPGRPERHRRCSPSISPQPAYWRLTSLDTFDGAIWRSSGRYTSVDGRLPERPARAASPTPASPARSSRPSASRRCRRCGCRPRSSRSPIDAPDTSVRYQNETVHADRRHRRARPPTGRPTRCSSVLPDLHPRAAARRRHGRARRHRRRRTPRCPTASAPTAARLARELTDGRDHHLRQGHGPAVVLPRHRRLRLRHRTSRRATATDAIDEFLQARRGLLRAVRRHVRGHGPRRRAAGPGRRRLHPGRSSDPTDPRPLRGPGRARPRLARGLPGPVRMGAVRAHARARGNPNAEAYTGVPPAAGRRRHRTQTTTTTVARPHDRPDDDAERGRRPGARRSARPAASSAGGSTVHPIGLAVAGPPRRSPAPSCWSSPCSTCVAVPSLLAAAPPTAAPRGRRPGGPGAGGLDRVRGGAGAGRPGPRARRDHLGSSPAAPASGVPVAAAPGWPRWPAATDAALFGPGRRRATAPPTRPRPSAVRRARHRCTGRCRCGGGSCVSSTHGGSSAAA